jgi:hypothetical protein
MSYHAIVSFQTPSIGDGKEEEEQLFQLRSCLSMMHGYTHLYLVHTMTTAEQLAEEKSANQRRRLEAYIRNRFWPGTLVVALATTTTSLSAGDREVFEDSKSQNVTYETKKIKVRPM